MRLKDPGVLWPLGEGPAVVGTGKSGERMNVQSLAGMRVRPTPAFQPLALGANRRAGAQGILGGKIL